ncbi:MAG: DUF1059 domain-containing protein [Candidatus Bathyarchaeota archaeon]|nr:DUF1059 domain-containing protein [Candidatus Bathyarchaeota archaeon]
MPSFRCRGIGMKCDFEVSAKTKNELMMKIGAHAKAVHDMEQIPSDVTRKVKNAIKK